MDNMPDLSKNALREYISNSEMRVIVDGVFNARMSADIAKKFDSGEYDFAINEQKNCIKELQSLNIKYPANAKPVFYMYIVPDDNFVELLKYPHNNRKGGGKPVASYDLDGFNSAYGASQNTLTFTKAISIDKHVNNIHEYAHLIQGEFAMPSQFFCEGFAELVPWYALQYESRVPEHFAMMKSLKKIYSANDLINSGNFLDVVENKTCSFQPSYISAYLWSRAVTEQIRKKFNLSREQTIQKLLEFYAFTGRRNQFFVIELAHLIGMDPDKLLNSTEYQMEMLKQIEQEIG